jgi:uncharacterized protein YbjT (DUF2867 family)
MRMAITTPTGRVGSKLVQQLLEDGSHELILLARKPEKLEREKERGAKVVQADLTDRQAVRKATEGVDALFWVNPSNYGVNDYIAYYEELAHVAANAIKANNIQRVVLLSSMGAQYGKHLGPVEGLKKTEEIIKDAANNLTILRPTFFMENFFMTLDGIKSDNHIYLPVKGETRVPMIATADVARAAYDALIEPFNGTQIKPLYGPRDYTFDEVAATIGETIGKKVEHVRVSPEQAIQSLTEMGATKNVATLYVGMFTGIDQGYMRGETPRTTGSTTDTTLEDFSKNYIAPNIES